MKRIVRLSMLAAVLLSGFVYAAENDTRCFELRTYTAAPGKLDALLARFRDHTCKIFERHGMVNVGYWVPLDNSENKVIYLLAYPDKEARNKSWKAFMADPDWQSAWKASEQDGKLVAKAESVFLSATDYSPSIAISAPSEPRTFEFRTYTASPGKLESLNKRFREHTVGLFAKHGMTQVGYWNPMADQKGADNTLFYILAHESKDAAAKSFGAFRQDLDWLAAKSESEKNGSLTVSGGVKSVFAKATDFSPMK
ncbi:MAG: NIPSNAP family protein [Verrucomicrobia bacterium]|nr:NIPSNAP family protein [Verrucomicrobiota bacterium]